ncbi:MAG: glycosyltransferase [Tannerellaceae bacterium]|nr:glycosyltransferase [Tannerellaceae bacterium]
MEKFFSFTALEWIGLGLVSVFFTIQIIYYSVIYFRPYRLEKKQGVDRFSSAAPEPPVSIIVYARNESFNLQQNLPALLTQDYPGYEVIVINDGSTDESEDVLKLLENKYKHLYHTFIPQDSKYLSRKKLALTVGMKAAKNDILLFTEANCYPVDTNWIRAMVRNYAPDTEMVLGFCSYPETKGLFHKLMAYDNLLSGLEYLSAAIAGHPYTGNGRNLSYRKELFFRNKGYRNSLSLHAGEDDLFINALAHKKNTRAEYSRESLTEMIPFNRFSMWKEMKVSRAATQRFYTGGVLTFYRLNTFSFFCFLIGMIGLIVAGCYGNLFVAGMAVLLYLFLYLTKAIVLRKSSLLLNQKPLTGWLPLLEIILPVFHVYVRLYRVFRGKNDFTFNMGR